MHVVVNYTQKLTSFTHKNIHILSNAVMLSNYAGLYKIIQKFHDSSELFFIHEGRGF
jgi:hypothetical protein